MTEPQALTSRGALAGYWATTGLVAFAAVWAGATLLFRMPPLYEALLALGYPSHFATVLGFWKLAGAVAITAPRLPRVKEWAYAGLFIDYTGALVAHAAAGEGAQVLVGPVVSIALLIASWFLRPASRRLPD